jgi:hypothetical protein
MRGKKWHLEAEPEGSCCCSANSNRTSSLEVWQEGGDYESKNGSISSGTYPIEITEVTDLCIVL